MSIQAVKDAARGRWAEVLATVGVDSERLVNRHGPCPMCGGKDRFRYDDKDSTGSWYCNVCGAGSGFDLAMKANGWDVGTALRELATYLGLEKDAPRKDESLDRRQWLKRLVRECTDPAPIAEYLASRGLTTVPDCLRYHPALPYVVDGKVTGEHPAMLAIVHGKDGSPQGLHRTYLSDVRTRKKLTPAVRSYTGGAIRLWPEASEMVVCEGIETAIAVHEMAAARGRDVSVWAAGNTTLMRQWEPPACVRSVTVAADHDENYAGHAAAYALAHRLATRGLRVRVEIPTKPGDWLDHWLKIKESGGDA